MPLTGPERGPHSLKGWLPWIAVGLVMVVLAGVAVMTLFVDEPQEATEAASVQDVADLAVEAAESLDIEAGTDLLCEEPMFLYQQTLETMIKDARDRTGTVDPSVDYAVSDVSDGATGSFVVAVSSTEEELADQAGTLRVFVEEAEGRSCIVGIGDEEDDEPDIRLSASGYTGPETPPSTPPSAPGTSSTPAP